MPFSTIATPEARPVANYKMGTRMEGGRLLYVSGQVAWDASGSIVGKGDVGAQARQTFQNLRQVLQAAGATSEPHDENHLHHPDRAPAGPGRSAQRALHGEQPGEHPSWSRAYSTPDFPPRSRRCGGVRAWRVRETACRPGARPPASARARCRPDDARAHAVVEEHLRRPRAGPRSARWRRAAPSAVDDLGQREVVRRDQADGAARRPAPRTIASAPMRRSCELVPCRSSSSRKSTGSGPRGERRRCRAAAGSRRRSATGPPAASPGCAAWRPIASGDSRSRAARTGAPASASTALTPTVRSSVLLPDMFEPLTTSTRGGAARAARRCARSARSARSGCAERLRLEARRARPRRSGKRRPGARRRSPPASRGPRARRPPRATPGRRRRAGRASLDGQGQLGAPQHPARRARRTGCAGSRAGPPRTRRRRTIARRAPPILDQVRVEPGEQRAPERLALERAQHSPRAARARRARRSPRRPPARAPQTPADHALDRQRATPGCGGTQPAAHDATATAATAEGRRRPRRSARPAGVRRAVARVVRASGRTVAATSSPRTARSSRRSRRGVSACTAACRARTAAGSDGASSQAASVSSPMLVRAAHSSSNSEPSPKRSRSAA